MEKETPTAAPAPRPAPQTLSGVVVAARMKDTATVLVTRLTKHPLVEKYIRRSKKYLVHDPGNTRAVGERVTIVASRPFSKRKRFRMT